MVAKTVPAPKKANPDKRATGQFQSLQLECAWELDKIARTLPDLVPLNEDQTHFAVKALAGRMLRLTSALMLLSEEVDGEADLERVNMMVNLVGDSQG